MKRLILLVVCALSFLSLAQKPFSYKLDKNKIKFGEEIILTLQTKTDTLTNVVFPEAQTFGALEVIESYKTDTLLNGLKRHLTKKYGISFYDSARVVLPRIPVYINNKPFFTDSISIEVLPVEVDTLKQQMHDIKDVIAADEVKSTWWKWLLGLLLLLAIIGIGIYLYKKYKKKKPAEEIFKKKKKKARFLLKKLNYKNLIEQEDVKAFYSELTDILRVYIEDTLDVPAKESTTNELLALLKETAKKRKLPFGKTTLTELEKVLKEADLVKFAKSKPLEFELESHKNKIESSILDIQKSLPEVEDISEEEENELLRLELEKKRKRKRTIWTIFFSLLAVVLISATLLLTVGMTWLRDNYIGHSTKSLLDVEWVTSTYGYPGITIETPKVLERKEQDKNFLEEGIIKDKAIFTYGSVLENFNVVLLTLTFDQKEPETDFTSPFIAQQIKDLEKIGVTNFIMKEDDYQLNNEMKGKKIHGSADWVAVEGKFKQRVYIEILGFSQKGACQQIMFIRNDKDENAKLLVDRMIKSIELQNISQQ